MTASAVFGAVAQEADYRSAASAPSSWQSFAGGLQGRLQQRLAGNDADARAFQDYMRKYEPGSSASPMKFVARIWILPDGRIERLEFDGLEDKEIAVHLRALLTRDNVGAPPEDMLQPLRLRLSLRPNERPAGDK
ncbi:hypothetical protein [Bradyrhizobium sp. NAS80.1]|uniref:hypothetical protein n=1 Tax=Bradyrhizobium sp. NAS80.1 TaxID=1680159 RepID=UPI0011611437|nr:hypothetical protein [Bradyrhizobium sp. NAS80.1]